ncbi:exosortase-associated EpsI family protein [Isosphaeraceae bacterium EP7]
MSSLLPLVSQIERPAVATKPARLSRPARSVWTWAIPAIILLALSGAFRAWQDVRFAEEIALNKVVPFSLKKIPAKLGDWEILENGEALLDPRIIQIAGASDYVLRSYINKKNGVTVTALVLSGPAEAVIAHIPEVCYPANGYRPSDMPDIANIKVDNDHNAQFRSLAYAKGGSIGEPPFKEEVFYSFLFKGNWNPFPASFSRITKRSPWVIKIQAQRRIGASENREIDNPSQDFLAKLLPEVEALIKASGVKSSVEQASAAPQPTTALVAGH